MLCGESPPRGGPGGPASWPGLAWPGPSCAAQAFAWGTLEPLPNPARFTGMAVGVVSGGGEGVDGGLGDVGDGVDGVGDGDRGGVLEDVFGKVGGVEPHDGAAAVV